MRTNLPVTQRGRQLPSGEALLSATDTSASCRIQYANATRVHAGAYHVEAPSTGINPASKVRGAGVTQRSRIASRLEGMMPQRGASAGGLLERVRCPMEPIRLFSS
jgi:hypothetical protein